MDYNNCEVGQILEGKEIKKILGKDENIIVFVYGNNVVTYCVGDAGEVVDYDKKVNKLSSLFSRLNKHISTEISVPFIPKWITSPRPQQITAMKFDVGSAFFLACASKDSNINVDNHFIAVENMVKEFEEHVDKSRVDRLIFTNLIHSVIVCIFLFIPFLIWGGNLVISVLGGVMGACLSVLQRKKRIYSGAFSSLWETQVSSILSVTLGAMSGLVVFLLIESGILFSNYNSNSYGFVVISMLAGISERYFNTLIESSAKF